VLEVCTEFCVISADCSSGVIPTCGIATIGLPSGMGTQNLDVCVP
jgi:hypothetical protein